MQIIKYPPKDQWNLILRRPVKKMEEIEKVVLPLIKEVQKEGDQAIFNITRRIDQVKLDSLIVTQQEIEESKSLISAELASAIAVAKSNIETFHKTQLADVQKVETMPGVTCWRKSVGIQKVGFYIPGGTAPLFSTILMLAVPATIAGCQSISLCTPPNKEGKIHPAILYTASLCGIKNIYKVGGAQAIAAMAYGTKAIEKVFKIFGPGNQYVTAAKQLINKDGIAIDMPAGPSEVAVIADETSNPVFVAADLLSQAEHGADSQVLLVSTDEHIVQLIQEELQRQVALLPRMVFAMQSLENSTAIIVKTEDEVMAIMNQYAPEHLIIATDHPEVYEDKIINAGSVFMGHYTPEAAGDYASGTNHTLPTNGFATAYSGVSVDSFCKKITFQTISTAGIRNIGSVIEMMAEAEGLLAHKNAVKVRLDSLR